MKTRIAIVLAVGLTVLSLLGSAAYTAAQDRPIPDPDLSFWVWSGLAADEKVLICPAGDGQSSIVVTVLDAAAMPIVGETVTVNYLADCDACFCPPFSTTTGLAGTAVIYPAGGLGSSIVPDCCDVTTTVTCLGVTIGWTTMGYPSDTREWRSFDLDGDCLVALADLVILQADINGGNPTCRCDFDGSGAVNISDLVQWQLHIDHWCDPAVPGPDIELDPTGFEFALPSSGTDCATLTISNVGDADLDWDLVETCAWLTLTPLSGTTGSGGSQDVDVCVDASGLATGGYNCDVVVTSNDPDEPTLVVSVSLDVTGAPDIDASPTSFTFLLQVGFEECDVLTISNNGDADLTWEIDGPAPWVTYTPGSGTIPPSGTTDVDICVDSTGAPPGQHTTNLVLDSNDPDTPTIWIGITMNVAETPQIGVTPTSFYFELWQGETECQSLTISNDGSGYLTWGAEEGCAWLTLDPPTGVIPAAAYEIVDVCTDAAGLPPGVYSCIITIGSNDPHTPSVAVPVDLTVLPTPDIEIEPPELAFELPHGTTDSQSLTVMNAGTTSLVWAVEDTVLELSFDPSGGFVAPGGSIEIEVTVYAAWGYDVGAHEWQFSFITNDPDEPVVDVPVTVTILPSTRAEVDPPAFVFDVGVGGSDCTSLEISNTGSGELAWATVDTCEWLIDNPSAGTTPPGESSIVEVCVSPMALPAGTYQCDLVIDTNEPDQATIIVPVTLNVHPPIPDIDVTPTALSFHIVGTGTSCDEIEIGNVGYGNLDWMILEGCTWLVATPADRVTRPGTSNTIRVCASSTGLATGIYNCSVAIFSDDPDEPVIVVHVTLHVQIPSMAASHVDWVNLGCAGKVFICPHGHGSAITVSVYDTALAPIEGAQVVPFFDGTCERCMGEPISVVTGPLGSATMAIYGGIDSSTSPDCCVITTTMYIGGQAIPWLATGLPSDTREFLSPDLNGDCVVDAPDQAIFMLEYGSSACRSDFDCDGVVGGPDLVVFFSHLGHSCMNVVAGIEENEEIEPRVSTLEQNYPNPFNPVTKIAFTVAEAGRVVLRVYDAAGRPVKTLADRVMVASRYEITWDGADDLGRQVASGVYFYRLEIAGELETRKMVLLK